jgi:hypothetical protein
VRDYRGYPVVKRVGELQRICRMKVRAPLVAFVHWGEEYTDSAQPADHAAAQALHACGVDLIVGAHSHRAAARIDAPQGGEFQMVFSLGNLLFDQRGDRASAALLELRLFGPGDIRRAAGAAAEPVRPRVGCVGAPDGAARPGRDSETMTPPPIKSAAGFFKMLQGEPLGIRYRCPKMTQQDYRAGCRLTALSASGLAACPFSSSSNR